MEEEASVDLDGTSNTEGEDYLDTWGADESEHSVVTAVSSLTKEVVSKGQSCSTRNEDTCISEYILDTPYSDVHDSDKVFYHSADSEVVHMPENYHFQIPHRLIRQLRVDDRRVDIVVEHFDVTRQMLSTLSWSALMTDE